MNRRAGRGRIRRLREDVHLVVLGKLHSEKPCLLLEIRLAETKRARDLAGGAATLNQIEQPLHCVIIPMRKVLPVHEHAIGLTTNFGTNLSTKTRRGRG